MGQEKRLSSDPSQVYYALKKVGSSFRGSRSRVNPPILSAGVGSFKSRREESFSLK
jgi:hypothetical protein